MLFIKFLKKNFRLTPKNLMLNCWEPEELSPVVWTIEPVLLFRHFLPVNYTVRFLNRRYLVIWIHKNSMACILVKIWGRSNHGTATAIVKEIRNGAHGIVIGHGTDTMHHTAAILSFMVQNSPVPIVMVGSQRSSNSSIIGC